jgi:hypothetical protein
MNVAEFASLFADDGVINLAHAGMEPLGLESWRGDQLGELVTSIATYYPDVHRELHRVNALGDMVAVELSIQGTFLGPTRREDRAVRLQRYVQHHVRPNGRELTPGAVFSVLASCSRPNGM